MNGLIAHEWIGVNGGSEKVLNEMVDCLPGNDVFCLWNEDASALPNANVQESWLAASPLRQHKSLALPLMPETWRRKRTVDYDWLLISSHAFAHHLRAPLGKVSNKFVYVHTPARYLWAPEIDPRGRGRLARLASPLLRGIDRRAVQHEANYAANSGFVAQRVRRAWGVNAPIIYPPVDTEAIATAVRGHMPLSSFIPPLPEKFVLGASRFVPYKRLDALIEMGASAGIPVVIAGSGPDEARLRNLADKLGAKVTFVIAPDTVTLYQLYAKAAAFAFLSVEDFGIMPVEALAAGTPAIVLDIGGAAESVEHGVSGVQLSALDATEFAEALRTVTAIDPEACRSRAQRFSHQRFRNELHSWMGDHR